MSIFAGKRRLLAVIAAVVAAFALTGCGARITVSDYTSNGVRYNMYTLSFDADTVEQMERTAATDGDGEKYTVEGYFYELFTVYGYELAAAEKTSDGYSVSYVKAVDGNAELYTAGTVPSYTQTSVSDPFIRTYRTVSPNPFNGVRATYDAIEPDRSFTMLERIKNGAVVFDEYGERSVIFPALTDAFPYIRGNNPDGLPLDYIIYGAKRTQSSGTTIKAGDGTAHVFTRYFDNTETTIELSDKRAVPYGWYLVALGAGGTVFAVIFLATRRRKKKQKPTLLDRFPYNPEQYRDYDSHLPM